MRARSSASRWARSARSIASAPFALELGPQLAGAIVGLVPRSLQLLGRLGPHPLELRSQLAGALVGLVPRSVERGGGVGLHPLELRFQLADVLVGLATGAPQRFGALDLRPFELGAQLRGALVGLVPGGLQRGGGVCLRPLELSAQRAGALVGLAPGALQRGCGVRLHPLELGAQLGDPLVGLPSCAFQLVAGLGLRAREGGLHFLHARVGAALDLGHARLRPLPDVGEFGAHLLDARIGGAHRTVLDPIERGLQRLGALLGNTQLHRELVGERHGTVAALVRQAGGLLQPRDQRAAGVVGGIARLGTRLGRELVHLVGRRRVGLAHGGRSPLGKRIAR